MGRGVHNNRGGNQQYVNKREDPLKDKGKAAATVGSASGLPTPEPEPKKLPAVPDIEPTRDNPNPPEMITPPSQSTSRAGKAPERLQIPVPDITPTDAMKSIGAILHSIKQNVTQLENTLEGIGKQAAALTALHAPLKLQEEYQTVQQELRKQIQRQNEEIKQKRDELEGLLMRQLDEKIRRRIDAQVREIVGQTVAGRIQTELDRLIPEELKMDSLQHRERTLRIRSNLINNEARRRNAKRTGRLHPLVVARPAAVSRSSSGSTATPSTAGGLLATPLDSNSLQLFTNGLGQPDDEGYPVSPAFPMISQDLFNCYKFKDRRKIQQLLEDYEGPEMLTDLKDDLQVVNAIDWLGHNFGVLGPGDHFILPPVGGQPLSPLIMSSD
ncbi:hypothetical protein JOM56_002465 [Amanita muscaria]